VILSLLDVDPEVIKKSNTISSILGKKPEEYYEIVKFLKDKPLEMIIEYILN